MALHPMSGVGPFQSDDDFNNPELRRLVGLCGLDRGYRRSTVTTPGPMRSTF